MPEIYQVQANLFTDLFKELQIVAVPRAPLWYLSDTIIPVSLINSQVTLDATLKEEVLLFATEGPQVAPGANTLLADTGQLDAGNYFFRVYINWLDTTGGTRCAIQQRDPTNATNDWEMEVSGFTNNPVWVQKEWAQAIAEDERVRVETSVAFGAAQRVTALIWRKALSS